MSSGGTEHVSLPAGPGVSLRVAVPRGAVREPEGALPIVDVSNLPGARVPVRAGFRGDEAAVRVVCATAPSRGWAPGVEQIVMGRASQIARGALGGEVTRFEATDTQGVEARFEQRFEASVQRGGEAVRATGRHVLGFAGEERDAIVCSVVCTEAEGRHGCGELVQEARAEGRWVEAPAASLVVRSILLAAEQPAAAGGVALGAAVLIAGAVIARRPRPRAWP